MPIETLSARLCKNILVLVSVFTLSATSLSVAVGADEVLYKWREADGSITFSPKPPAKNSGIEYEKVGSQSGTAKLEPALKSQTAGQEQIGALAVQSKIAKPSHQKRAQCSELQKRVMSLERLLRTEISAETMDNAVIQMARYQNSFNQSCNRRQQN